MRLRKISASKSSSSRLNNFSTTNAGPRIKTGGEVFEDGRLIELIGEAGNLRLLISNGVRHGIGPLVAHRGRSYSPLDLDPSLLRAVTLPARLAPREPTEQLFNDVRDLLHDYDFSEDIALLATYFCFATWFPDCIPAAPCFVVTGPKTEALLFFQILGCLVRHALPLVDISITDLFSLPAKLQLTVLVQNSPSTKRSLRILLASFGPNSNFLVRGGVVNLYGARAIYLGEMLCDDISEEVLLHANLGPSRRRVPVIDARSRQMIASKFQPRFLGYRVRNYSKVRASECDPPQFASGLRVLALTLEACIVDAPNLQAGVCTLLQGQQENVLAERWLDVRCIAIEALLAHCHRKNEAQVYVGEITKAAVTIFKFRGQTVTLEPRRLGGILRKLFHLFPTRDSKGFKIVLTDVVRRRVHQLAYNFGVAGMMDRVARCKHCSEMFAPGSVGRDG